MKTHFFEEHPFLICSGHQTKPIHKFSCFAPQNNPHFVNRLDYVININSQRILGVYSLEFDIAVTQVSWTVGRR